MSSYTELPDHEEPKAAASRESEYEKVLKGFGDSRGGLMGSAILGNSMSTAGFASKSDDRGLFGDAASTDLALTDNGAGDDGRSRRTRSASWRSPGPPLVLRRTCPRATWAGASAPGLSSS